MELLASSCSRQLDLGLKLSLWDVTEAISMGSFILLQLPFDYGWPCSGEAWFPLALPCARWASSRAVEGWLVLTGAAIERAVPWLSSLPSSGHPCRATQPAASPLKSLKPGFSAARLELICL